MRQSKEASLAADFEVTAFAQKPANIMKMVKYQN